MIDYGEYISEPTLGQVIKFSALKKQISVFQTTELRQLTNIFGWKISACVGAISDTIRMLFDVQ